MRNHHQAKVLARTMQTRCQQR